MVLHGGANVSLFNKPLRRRLVARKLNRHCCPLLLQRPMVRLQAGQKVKTEWNGSWLLARVEKVDASLVKMQFEVGGRRWPEWIYRGSTRLEPLYNEMVSGSTAGRHVSSRSTTRW